tara:strand:- start:4978 stop:5883 length:906 start_codon:yes stop_codon:yes gene_type:complete
MRSNQNNPRMFDSRAEFANIKLNVDPINRKRTENNDNVMAMFYEEQPFMWEYVKEKIAKTINKIRDKEKIDFLDIGTGSGVWSILVSKNIRQAKKVIALDKSPRAIKWAKLNAKSNNVKFNVVEAFYNISVAPYKSCKVIGIYVPYHIYPIEMELDIPQHARGGTFGQQVFKEQLVGANYHLADEGIIVFNQMCLGRKGKPEFTRYIPELIEDVSIEYINIFPPIKTKDFLSRIYPKKYSKWINNVSKKYPELYYCDGIIRRDKKGKIKEVKHNVPLMDRTWEDRIKLHSEIAKHGMENGK